jgi:cytochrome c oxidase assembly protein subunit 15
MVTSTGSGLAVPDWPTTFGQNMFAYPVREMKGGIFYEHGHRLFASGIGILTVALTAAIFLWETRPWVKALAAVALMLVCVQGILGGITVRYQLPVAVSSAHGGLAQMFFCTLVWLTWATSRAWMVSASWRNNAVSRVAFSLMALAYAQILVGAVMRHSHAGLAIPTFPLAFGSWIPSFWSNAVFLNFLHTRIGPLMLTAGCLALALALIRGVSIRPGARLGFLLLLVLGAQLALGVLTVWTGRLPWMASLHLAGGALTMGILFTVALWSGKPRENGAQTLPKSEPAEMPAAWAQPVAHS